jgi:hypothetical protein
MTLHEIIPVLQVAIGPVILISGVGMLLLVMTNRFARTIDRARQLAAELRRGNEPDRALLLKQVGIIYRRARVLRVSITLAVVSVLLAALLIIVLFVTALMHSEHGRLVVWVFIACLSALIGSVIALLADIHLSLAALRLELRPAPPVPE